MSYPDLMLILYAQMLLIPGMIWPTVGLYIHHGLPIPRLMDRRQRFDYTLHRLCNVGVGLSTVGLLNVPCLVLPIFGAARWVEIVAFVAIALVWSASALGSRRYYWRATVDPQGKPRAHWSGEPLE